MNKRREPFTPGIRTVKAGNEKIFIEEWNAYSARTAKHQAGARQGYLLQDPGQPWQFIPFGAWEHADEIKSWRETPEFKAFASRAQTLCDEFRPRSLVLAAASEEWLSSPSDGTSLASF